MSVPGQRASRDVPEPLVRQVPQEFGAPTPPETAPTSPMIRSVPQVADSPPSTEEDPPVIDVPRFCPSCGVQVTSHDQYCEGCGLPLMPVDQPPVPGPNQATAATQRLRAPVHVSGETCSECGNTVGLDGYCETCGTRARPERDHYEESIGGWIAGVCDRGQRHERNEDALALGLDPLNRAIVVVCDGVSTAEHSDVGALAGARAARDLLVAEPTDGQGTTQSRSNAIGAALVDATVAANAGVMAVTPPESDNAASCTIVAAVAAAGEVHYAHLGDSRLYWFGDDGDLQLLTADDSVAQTRIAMGVARDEAESGPNAHAITRWLGRDSEDIIPHTGALQPACGGWVLACSDGLWNYASDPPSLWAQFVAAGGNQPHHANPLDLSRALVAWANQQGGRDNITVALVRLSPSAEPSPDQE